MWWSALLITSYNNECALPPQCFTWVNMFIDRNINRLVLTNYDIYNETCASIIETCGSIITYSIYSRIPFIFFGYYFSYEFFVPLDLTPLNQSL